VKLLAFDWRWKHIERSSIDDRGVEREKEARSGGQEWKGKNRKGNPCLSKEDSENQVLRDLFSQLNRETVK